MSVIPDNLVCFAHGKESGPWGTKIQALAGVARRYGCAVESPDYSGVMDPAERVRMLLDLRPRAGGCLILAGSSMGGYVAAAAAESLKPQGLFLMAPAFYIDAYPLASPPPAAGEVMIVHGWNDDVIPVDHSIQYAREHGVPLHLLSGDHRLTSVLPVIEKLFEVFLRSVLERNCEAQPVKSEK